MSKLMKAVTISVCSVLLVAGSVFASEDDWLIRAAPDRDHDPPQTIDASESMTGNAAPVVPQRESERKEAPEPDYLMGKVIWGESATFTAPGGGEMDVDDWNLVPSDVSNMMGKGRAVGQTYHWSNVHLDEFSYDPERMPVLFFSGVRSLRLNESQKKALRKYVLDGGMLVLDSVYGSPHFTESARETFMEVFPGKQFRLLPEDHPLLQTYYEIDSLNYPEQPDKEEPHLEGMYIGARVGVLLTPYGMGTGLAGEQDVFGELRDRGLEPRYMCEESARTLSTNLIGYAVGYADVGRVQGQPEVFGQADEKNPSDEFVFAQIRHEGAWNAHPGAAASLLTQMRHRSSVRVHLKRVAVDLAQDDLSGYTFLYLTGLDSFEFSASERQALRDFITSGGFLFVNNGLGLSRFHQSAIRELEQLLPSAELNAIDPRHELFNILVPSERVEYTSVLQRRKPELEDSPMLLGMEHEGDLAVVYSPYDIEAGWLSTHFPLMRGYQNQSAQRLGMNIVTYSMVR